MIRTSRRRVCSAVSILGIVAIAAVGCSSSNPSPAPSDAAGLTSPASSIAGGTSSGPPTEPTTPSPAGSSSPATSLDLSGSWSGTYGGGYSGTFKLTWEQSAGKLTGTIVISDPATTAQLDGTLKGTTITFGTVGGLAVTYTGTASTAGMSGTYSVGGKAAGTWSATKSTS
jgi:hypothetical protein